MPDIIDIAERIRDACSGSVIYSMCDEIAPDDM
jgi:hypothetical protein